MSAPTISSLGTTSGTAVGGVPVTINGTNFTSDATVMFGPYNANDIVFVSSSELTCTTPPAKGLLDVTVIELGGTVVSSGAYTGIPVGVVLSCEENPGLNYARYIYDTPTKSDRDGDSILLDFTLADVDASFVQLRRGNYITFTTQTYPRWFTGYITNEPEYVFLGEQDHVPHWGYKYEASSDDYILSLNPLGIIPPFMNMTQGAIIKQLVSLVSPNLFDVSNVQDGVLLARYVVNPVQKFADLIKTFATNSVYRFYGQGKYLYFTPKTDLPVGLTLDATNTRFTPDSLAVKASTNIPIVNDCVVLGNIEPQRYCREYFIGDGATGQFSLTNSVFGVESVVLLDDDFSSTTFDTSKWTVYDEPANFLQVSNGYVNCLGGEADGSYQVHLDSASLIQLSGNMRIAHGEFDFVPQTRDNAVMGVIGGFWTEEPNSSLTGCVYGLQVSKASGIVYLNPIENGVVDTTQRLQLDTNGQSGNIPAWNAALSYAIGDLVTYYGEYWTCIATTAPDIPPTNDSYWAVSTAKRYVFRTLVSTQNFFPVPMTYVYMDSEGRRVNPPTPPTAFGKITYHTYITELDPNTGLIVDGYPIVWTNQYMASIDTLYALYIYMASDDLHVTATGLTISTPMQATLGLQDWGSTGFINKLVGPNEIDATDGLAPYATISQSGGTNAKSNILGTPTYNLGSPSLQFFKDTSSLTTTVPQIGDIIRLDYRSAGAAVGRARDNDSVNLEQANWGDSGVRSSVRLGDLLPLPQTSADCTTAAAAIIGQNSYTHYEGTYSVPSQNVIWEPQAGAVLTFENLTSDFPVSTFTEPISQVQTTFDGLNGTLEVFTHTISYGLKNDSVRLLSVLSGFQQQDNTFITTDTTQTPVFIPITGVGLAYAADIIEPSMDPTNGGTYAAWQDDHTYTVGDTILDSNDNLQQAQSTQVWLQNDAGNTGSSGALSATVSVAVNSAVVVIVTFDAAATITVTDSGGNSYSQVGNIYSSVPFGKAIGAYGLTSATASATSVTATPDTGNVYTIAVQTAFGVSGFGTSGYSDVASITLTTTAVNSAVVSSIALMDNTTATLVWGSSLEVSIPESSGIGVVLITSDSYSASGTAIQNSVTTDASASLAFAVELKASTATSGVSGATAPTWANFKNNTVPLQSTITADFVTVAGDVATFQSPIDVTGMLNVGTVLECSGFTNATFLNGTTVTVASIDGVYFTANVIAAAYSQTSDVGTMTVIASGGLPPITVDGTLTWNLLGHSYGVDNDYFYYDMNTTPPALGTFEVRYSDDNWGCDQSSNFIGRFTTQKFRLPRTIPDKTVFIKQQDGRNIVRSSEVMCNDPLANGGIYNTQQQLWFCSTENPVYFEMVQGLDSQGNLKLLNYHNFAGSIRDDSQCLQNAVPTSVNNISTYITGGEIGDYWTFTIDLKGSAAAVAAGMRLGISLGVYGFTSAAGGAGVDGTSYTYTASGESYKAVLLTEQWQRISVTLGPATATYGGANCVATPTVYRVYSGENGVPDTYAGGSGNTIDYEFYCTRASVEKSQVETIYCKTLSAGTTFSMPSLGEFSEFIPATNPIMNYGVLSQFAACINCQFPFVPNPPTGWVDLTDPTNPIVNVVLPGVAEDVWGVEIRASDNLTVLLHSNLTDSGYSPYYTVVNNTSTSLQFYLYTYNLLGEYSSSYSLAVTIAVPFIEADSLQIIASSQTLEWVGQNATSYLVQIDHTGSTFSSDDSIDSYTITSESMILSNADFFGQNWFGVTPMNAVTSGVQAVISAQYEPTAPSGFTGVNNRSGWTIVAKSGEHSGYPAINVLDGNLATVWWSGVETEGTSYITIGFGSSQTFDAVQIGNRGGGANRGQPDSFTVYTSPDNVTYTSQGTFTGAFDEGTIDTYKFSGGSVSASYLKIIFNTIYGPGGNGVVVGEIYTSNDGGSGTPPTVDSVSPPTSTGTIVVPATVSASFASQYTDYVKNTYGAQSV